MNQSINEFRKRLLDKLEDLTSKIKDETPFPEKEQDLDSIIDIDSEIERILENWYY